MLLKSLIRYSLLIKFKNVVLNIKLVVIYSHANNRSHRSPVSVVLFVWTRKADLVKTWTKLSCQKLMFVPFSGSLRFSAEKWAESTLFIEFSMHLKVVFSQQFCYFRIFVKALRSASNDRWLPVVFCKTLLQQPISIEYINKHFAHVLLSCSLLSIFKRN